MKKSRLKSDAKTNDAEEVGDIPALQAMQSQYAVTSVTSSQTKPPSQVLVFIKIVYGLKSGLNCTCFDLKISRTARLGDHR